MAVIEGFRVQRVSSYKNMSIWDHRPRLVWREFQYKWSLVYGSLTVHLYPSEIVKKCQVKALLCRYLLVVDS